MDTNIRDKFFEDLAAGAKWDVAVSIARNNPLPLDANSVFKSRADLDTYLAGKLAYVGQTVAIVGADETVLYVLDANKVPQEVGKATLGDNASISLDTTTGILKIVGFDAAQTGAQLTKGADGKVSWVVPSTDTVDGLKTTVESLKETVNGKAAVGEEGSEGYQPAVAGLVQKVADNAQSISDIDTAYKAADETTLSTAKTYTDTSISGIKVAIEKSEGGVEQIVIKSGDTVVSSVDASVFVQDSFLNDVAYDSTTGKVTFTWNMGDKTTKTDEIDIKHLVDTYTAGTGLKVENNEFSVDTTTIATVTSVNTAVNDAKTELNTEINKKADSSTLTSEISRIETKISTDIAAAIKAALETAEGAQKYALDADLTALKGRVSTAEGTLEDVDSKKHTHANKAELDKISDGDVEKWNNSAINSHTHANKTVLDGITPERVAGWDAAESNANAHTEAYAATKAQGTLADTAIQSITVLGKTLDKNTNTSLSVDEAKTALGLGNAAYTTTEAINKEISDAADALRGADSTYTQTIKSAYDLAASKITAAEVDTKIANAGHATAADLTSHINNNGDAKHVSTDDITKWNTAATLVGQLTGDESGSLGSITDTIAAAIQEHANEADGKYATKTQTAADIKAVDDALKASIAETDKDVAQNTADVATLKEKDTAFESRIAALEGSKDDYKAADADLKTNLEGQITAATGTLTTAIATAKEEAIDEAKAYADDIKDTILGDNNKLKDTYDTLSEISEWIETHGSEATNLSSALAAETKAREDADTAIDSRLNALEQYDHAAYVAADTALKTNLEGQISTAKSDLTAAIATAKTEAITAAATDAATKVKTLEDGAVATNTANISTNTTNIAANATAITNLGTTKANAADVYAKTETYTRTEIDAKVAAANIVWGSF